MRRRSASLVACVASALLVLPLASGAHHQPDHQRGGLTLTIRADPTAIVYGQTIAIVAKPGGSAQSGLRAVLESRASATGSFATVATATTGTDGSVAFTQIRPLANTRYRVTIESNPPLVSAELLVPVAIRASLRLSDSMPRAGGLVRFSGTATPAHDGAAVSIQRLTRRGYRRVAGARLRDAGSLRSGWSRRIRIRREGTYRAVVAGDADHAEGISRPRRIGVRSFRATYSACAYVARKDLTPFSRGGCLRATSRGS